MPREQGPPPRAVPESDATYFEILTKGVFQAGFSWEVIEQKWPAFQEAFNGFDIESVAAYGPPDEDRLLADAGIVRNGRKIQATIANAQTAQQLIDEHGGFKAWLASTAHLPWPDRKKAVSKPFSHFGPSSAYFFLYSVGEAVPPHEQESTWSDPVPAGYPEAVGQKA